ncbi:hypothetical protein [Gimesia aquarii]|uniref:Helix-turn-helix domain protein n=1 Tax=Gimesia aquarii TaxID=2527964 RepID=A0A517VQK2_9PLAN|nr:hypothetical protein [Gimesia aquarii]QDT95287.1 hypothetical protein V144x_07290 [Gimesia aquarii]
MTHEEFDLIVKSFGKERIAAALPQKEVCQVLGLVCLRDLTDDLGVSYDKFRRYMEAGKIPFPEVRLLRRTYYTTQEADAIKTKLKQAKSKKSCQ